MDINSKEKLQLKTGREVETNRKIELPSQKEVVTENKEEKEKEKAESNLMFQQKKISIVRLYCHISGKIEIILTIIAIITTIAAGCSGALKSWIFGDSTNSLSFTIEFEEIKKVIDKYPEWKELFDLAFNYVMEEMVEPLIKKQIKKYLILGSIMFVCNFLMMFLWTYLSLRQLHWLKNNYFKLILTQEQGWFDENNSFEFATKVQAQLEQIELGLGDRLGQCVMMSTEIISGFVIAFVASWKLALILITCFPFIIAGSLIMTLCTKSTIVNSRKTYEKAGGVAEELLYNIKTVTSFVNFDYEIHRFGVLIDKVEELEERKAFISGISVGVIIFGIFMGYTVTLLFARKLIMDNLTQRNIISDGEYKDLEKQKISVGEIQKVLYGIIGSIVAIGQIAPNIQIIRAACAASSDYFTLYERKPKIYVSKKELRPEKDTIKGKIEFKNIKFIYPSDKTQKPILDGLNLVIEPGKKIAFVGESGCGKSTTVNLIERLYDPVEGQILLDGTDIKEFNIEYLRSLIGYVQQEPVLFNRSIKENLIFGRQEELSKIGNPEEIIEKACKEASIEDFIIRNPDKYEYVVGVKGSKLSGGQKQRLAIARAILMQPKILILDEATSALDNQSEKEVQEALDNISKSNITTIIIAHRLSTIKNADVIFALKNGKVAEQGTHQELIDLNGYYANLVKSQIGTEDNHKEIEKNKEIKKQLTRKLTTKYSTILEHEELKKEEKVIKQEKISVKLSEIFALISNNKLDLIFGTIGGFLYGAGTPVAGLFFGKVLVALSPQNIEIIKKEGLRWALYHIGIAVIGGLSIFLKMWKLESLGNLVTAKMRKKVFKKYLELHTGFFDTDYNSPGSLLTKLSIDTTKVSAVVLSVFGSILSAVGGVICSLILGFIFDWRLTLISTAFLPFILFFTVFKAYYREHGTQGNYDLKIEAGSIISECVLSTKTIYSFNFQSTALEIYSSILNKENKDNLKSGIISGLLFGVGIFVTYSTQATLVKSSFDFIKNQTLTYSNSLCALNCLLTVGGICHSLMLLAELPKAITAFKSLFRILQTPSEINAFEEANKDKSFPSEFKGKIEFKNVTFAYPTKPDNIILKNLNLTINPGQHVALVGFSGSGKSTIIQLIERYYDPICGDIYIDGINLKEYNLYKLRQKIGLVSQEPVLFKRSVFENILYGNLKAKEDEVIQAAERASINKFFKNKQKGEKDAPVSGGEKQRLAIARTFLKDPCILLFDEATSALDKESEIEVQKSINELQKGRTSVTVAHRLSTILDSDVIFFLEYGQVKEQGTHEELLAKHGRYYKLYESSEK